MFQFLFLLLWALAASAQSQSQSCDRITLRKEMNDLTDAEWDVYLSTLVASTTTLDPDTGLSVWEAGVEMHRRGAMLVHGNPIFFFFHRYLVQWMERKLQSINPDFRFFYWDSSREFNTWTQSKIWSKLGRPNGPNPVREGPFAG